MRKRIIRSLTATVLITSIMGMTVLADEVTDIKNQQNSLAQEKQNVEDELAFLLTLTNHLSITINFKKMIYSSYVISKVFNYFIYNISYFVISIHNVYLLINKILLN